jgi:magnesium transporter
MVMFRAMYFAEGTGLRNDLNLMDVAFALQDPKGLLWVDFDGEEHDEVETVMQKTFKFHPLAVNDALRESHVPKVDDWRDYLYVVFHAVVFDDRKGGGVDTLELDAFMGANYLVTYHEKPMETVDQVWETVQNDERQLKYGSDFLLYRLSEGVAASYLPVVQRVEDTVDWVETQIFRRPAPDTLEYIFTLKRAMLRLRRIVNHQRDVLGKLGRENYPIVDKQARVYYRDVYDHLVRLHDIIEDTRDLLIATLDTYLSVVNNRMNEVMKTLTIITTLFMPLSFLVGFFGMNFFVPANPIHSWMAQPIFYLVFSAVLATPATMFFWIWRRGWM